MCIQSTNLDVIILSVGICAIFKTFPVSHVSLQFSKSHLILCVVRLVYLDAILTILSHHKDQLYKDKKIKNKNFFFLGSFLLNKLLAIRKIEKTENSIFSDNFS